MIDFDTKFPKDASNAAWQKAKSFKDKTDKTIKKTGLGPELLKAEKAWNAIPWKQLDFRTAKARNMEEARQNLQRAEDALDKFVLPATTALRQAAEQAARVKANRQLSDSSRAAADLIHGRLLRAKSLLDKLSLADLKSEVTRQEQTATNRNVLKEIELRLKPGGHVANAMKGWVKDDGSVTLEDVRWLQALPRGKTYKDLARAKATVEARRLDGSLYLNDLTIVRFSADGKKAALK